jgi:enamine deaminase RidA (YjgF/YER057c/UK114 family)
LSRGTVKLTDGRILTDIDRVVIATGYHITLPFLRYLHNDSLTPEEADETILVTDGSQVHNLHKDIFYIPDPTLAFVGIPFYSATFTLFEFQAIAVAKVFSGQVSLPTEEEQRQEYAEKVKRKGLGRGFHSLREDNGERIYVRELVGWINSQVPEGEKVEGHTKKFLQGFDARLEKIRLLYEGIGSIKEVLSDRVKTEKVDEDVKIEVASVRT